MNKDPLETTESGRVERPTCPFPAATDPARGGEARDHSGQKSIPRVHLLKLIVLVVYSLT
ncbi:MAG TPA: hypothetical protein VLD18_16220 [Verrucomicrobiae bacterium]|nr:hypothetical protein [Verrucomicrobiae bacterium]